MTSTKQNMSNTSNPYQGLQSCLNPLVLKPHILNQNNYPIVKSCKSEKSTSGWSFIQALTSTSNNYRQLNDESEQVYVHPLAKCSSSSLSVTSLEMCTETLGSETGNNIDPHVHEFPCPIPDKQSSSRTKQPKIRKSNSFPPPLTSISGGDGVQVQAYREGGRLVIKASSFSSCTNLFKAERENGRLRLSFFKHDERKSDENEVKNINLWGENVKEDGGIVGGKIGGGEWPSSRCNEDGSGNKRLPSLPFCVAIS